MFENPVDAGEAAVSDQGDGAGDAPSPRIGFAIDELADASVPNLTAVNPTDRPILLVEGEQFVGGDQNRTLNVHPSGSLTADDG